MYSKGLPPNLMGEFFGLDELKAEIEEADSMLLAKRSRGKNKVGLAKHELVVDGLGRNPLTDEERVCMAHHLVGKLEHDFSSDVFPSEESCGALGKDYFHN
ncbi:hypothetical protein M0R45_016190 [Rubus argutus]|uniref:Uncharacterized protein n=1 Tax=Rubus argutus TaxID=59490 RepID=A0AAW1XUC3_RUBAR